ncbi:MAG: uroporphyrinogen decarboxylase family protein [Clostridiales bacterium]|jgi:uroporphyrinogen decarboxylase|nr:uroporphyrinogen-III decarboxylase [Eubacteriales bacterium]MDH7567875.1 uroporphyrinogen decarboxylase family protein [Clostridiales bacterium]
MDENTKTGQELYKEHLERLKKAVANEKTDRPPINLNADAFLVQYGGGKVSDLVNDPEYGNDLIIKALQKLGDVDCGGPGAFPAMGGGAFFFARIKLPGRELPDNMIWQIDELRPMTEQDYDVIIDKGFGYYTEQFMKKYFPETEESKKDMEAMMQLGPKVAQKYIDAGYVTLGVSQEGGTPQPGMMCIAGAPFNSLSAARGTGEFLRDIKKMPDKVLEAMNVMHETNLKTLRDTVRTAKPLTVFTGGGREAGDFLSIKDFEKFAWKYFKEAANVVIEEGSYCYLHLDCSWDRFVKYFLELPKNKMVFGPDGTTNIFKAADVLYGHTAFYGDVHPSMMSLGTPDEVYAYCKKLMDRFADKGFIMSTGCAVPSNAKPENVEAVVAAALGK